VSETVDRGLNGVNISDVITGLYCSGPDGVGDAPFRRGFLGYSADGGSLLLHSPLKWAFRGSSEWNTCLL